MFFSLAAGPQTCVRAARCVRTQQQPEPAVASLQAKPRTMAPAHTISHLSLSKYCWHASRERPEAHLWSCVRADEQTYGQRYCCLRALNLFECSDGTQRTNQETKKAMMAWHAAADCLYCGVLQKIVGPCSCVHFFGHRPTSGAVALQHIPELVANAGAVAVLPLLGAHWPRPRMACCNRSQSKQQVATSLRPPQCLMMGSLWSL